MPKRPAGVVDNRPNTRTHHQNALLSTQRQATPGSKRLRVNLVSRLRYEMENFYATGQLSELLLLQDALLMADSERSFKNAGDDCAIGNAIAECFGVNALAPVTPIDSVTARRAS